MMDLDLVEFFEADGLIENIDSNLKLKVNLINSLRAAFLLTDPESTKKTDT